MGWRDTQRAVASGAMSFRPEAPNDIREGIGLLLKTRANSIMDAAERQREASMVAMEEAKERRKQIHEEREAQEKLDRTRTKQARMILSNIAYPGMNPKDVNLINHVKGNLEVFGDDAAKTLAYYEDLGERFTYAASKVDMAKPGRAGDLNQQTAESMGLDATKMVETPVGKSPTTVKTDARNKMEVSESSGDPTASVVEARKGRKHAGLLGFGQARLEDYNRIYGTTYTPDTFAQLSVAEQDKVGDWHFNDISNFIRSKGLDKFIGEEINGTVLTESSIVAMAHLGGKTGVLRYLQTDGRVNAHDLVIDKNGKEVKTYMSDYARKFANSGSFTMQEDTGGLDPAFKTPVILPKKPEEMSLDDRAKLSKLTPSQRRSVMASLDLSVPQQKALHDDIQAMNAVESPVDMDIWLSGIGSVGTTMAQITKAEHSTNLSDDQKAKVLAALNTHLAKIQKDTDELNLTGETFVAPVSTDGGETYVRMSLQQRENGKYFSPTLNKTLDPGQIDMSNLQNSEEIDDLVSDAVRLQTEVFANMKIGRDGITDLLRRAKSLDDLVAASDGAVLTTVGGRLPALIKRLENEFDQLEPYFRDKSPQEVMGSFSKIVEQDYQEALQGDATLANSEKAQLYSVYQSRVLELAYVYATAGLNQTRITDQDFLKALEIVQAGSDYPTFTKSIRSLVNQAYENNKSSHDLYLKQPTYKAAKLRGGSDEVYNEFMIPLDEYLATQPQDIQASLEWMRAATPEINTGNPAQGIEIRLNNYLNSPQYEAAKDQLVGLNPTDRTTVIGMISKKFNIPVNILERQFPRGTK